MAQPQIPNFRYPRGLLIKSVNSVNEARVRFINHTNAAAEVIWIDFSSRLIRYCTLEPEQFLDANTYTHHPWMAINSRTKDNFHLNRKEIFVVKNFSREIMVGNEKKLVTPANIRIPVHITLPVDSLKLCAIKIVRELIVSEENVERLELPQVLMDELMASFENKRKNTNVIDIRNQ